MTIIEEIAQSWGWIGISPVEVVAENDFGNLIIKDFDGRYWRLCPEDVYCEVIAQNAPEIEALLASPEFRNDWDMALLVQQSIRSVGPLTSGRKYCLKIPGLLGGQYGGDNLASAPLVELIRFSGLLAQQSQGLPEGAQVKLKIVD